LILCTYKTTTQAWFKGNHLSKQWQMAEKGTQEKGMETGKI